jgi:peptidoglycan/xylan/chitin deacetylase (PgdA/CDA1 family)
MRVIVHSAAAALGVSSVARTAFASRLLVVCYHGVCAGEPDVPDPDGLHVPSRLFEQQIGWIVRHYQPVSLMQVLRHSTGQASLPNAAVLLTFDDGYRNVTQYALPVLRAMGVPCAVFPVAAAVEAGRLLWGSTVELRHGTSPGFRALRRSLKAMSVKDRHQWLAAEAVGEGPQPQCDHTLAAWGELAEAQATGLVAIGSHGLGHEPLTTCDLSELEEELSGSRQLLQQRLKTEVEAISYPNGDWSPAVVQAARKAGFRLGFTTAARHVRANEDPMTLPRILVGRSDGPTVLASRLSGWQEWLWRS